ncbi:elongation factor 1-gamma-like [Sycon ciliatum]|uniref:Elongation factor 1-gamma n=1 Tax=Sycon ciliatum TaxID=27933 RepID=M1XMM6_9METZ|nr:Translation elongation factor EF-1 gamma [Sycon ciliatum]|eukprot:scpid59780/ scgid20831/ Elongation factor 1-gamma; eEF-1B gamma
MLVVLLFRAETMAGTLYTYGDNFRAQKVLIAAAFSGTQVNVAPDFKLGETNTSADFLSKFPLGKVPAFLTADGQPIYESNAIAHFVANEQLRGSTPMDAALVQQFVQLAENEILPAACTWVYPTLGFMQYNKQATEKAQEHVKTILQLLNNALQTRTYLVGERITLADITVAIALLGLYRQVLEPSFRAPYGNVNRWFTTIVNQPQAKSVLGEVTLCTTMAKFDPKKLAEMQPKKEKVEKKKEPKETKPKAEKKEKKPEPEEAAEEPAAPKAKDPFATFPKSSWDFDAFKRCYSNEDTITKAVPHFWENFDAENYSIWFSTYKYNDELAQIFMTSNLVNGMFQRLDKLRKNAFASVCILGEDNANSISGVWVWRGQDLVFDLSPDWQVDYESYDWRKLDPSADETKSLLQEYFAWEGDFGGKKFASGSVFK